MKDGLKPIHTQRLEGRVQKVWEGLGKVGAQYTLIGGTAIGLYCDHRKSMDVDISCKGRAEHPRTIRENIGVDIGKHKVLRRPNGVLIKFFATETSPKIEIHGTDPWKPVAPPVTAANGMQVAAPCDLAARKLAAMADRDAARDGEDLQALIDHGADIGAAARSIIKNLARNAVKELGRRLREEPESKWPQLTAHKEVLGSLEMAAKGIREAPPAEIRFERKDGDTFALVEKETETGRSRSLGDHKSIQAGLQWLADQGRIRTEDISELHQKLEEEFKRERKREIER